MLKRNVFSEELMLSRNGIISLFLLAIPISAIGQTSGSTVLYDFSQFQIGQSLDQELISGANKYNVSTNPTGAFGCKPVAWKVYDLFDYNLKLNGPLKSGTSCNGVENQVGVFSVTIKRLEGPANINNISVGFVHPPYTGIQLGFPQELWSFTTLASATCNVSMDNVIQPVVDVRPFVGPDGVLRSSRFYKMSEGPFPTAHINCNADIAGVAIGTFADNTTWSELNIKFNLLPAKYFFRPIIFVPLVTDPVDGDLFAYSRIQNLSFHLGTAGTVIHKPAPIPKMTKVIPTPNACTKIGSIIRTANRSLGEAIPIVGTGFGLNYVSDRVLGRKDDRRITIPLTESIVDGISSIKLTLKIAGREIVQSFSPSPNLSYEFLWDGKGPLGNPAGTQKLTSIVEYTKSDGSTELGTSQVMLGHWDSELQGLGGWTLSPVHKYEVRNQRLAKGDGNIRNGSAIPRGTGFLYPSEDGSEAYIFDANGLHLETRSGLTGELIYSMAYNDRNFLVSVTDQFQNVTRVNRNSSGGAISISAPFGQLTNLTFDSNFYLKSVSNPKGETHNVTYSVDGLLLSFTKPNGNLSTMSYDANGALLKDLGAGGNFTELQEILNGNSRTISSATAEGRIDSVNSVSSISGSSQTITNSSGLVSLVVDQPEGTSITADPTGQVSQSENSPDSRFGTLAARVSASILKVENTNLNLNSTTSQAAPAPTPPPGRRRRAGRCPRSRRRPGPSWRGSRDAPRARSSRRPTAGRRSPAGPGSRRGG